MFDRSFYFSLKRKYVSLFGTLFNDVVIIRYDDDNKEQIIKVPIEYAPKEHMLARIESDPSLDRPYGLLMPRMSFEEMSPMTYDGDRKQLTVNKVVARIADQSDRLNYQYVPVPWNIPFNLYIYVKYNEDGAKIVEQILPWFTPNLTMSVNLIPEMNEIKDIPVVIGAVDKDDRYETNLLKKRVQIITIPFTMKAYFYGPITDTGIILTVNTSFYIANTANIEDSVGNTEVVERVIIQPGLNANGEPVNYYGPPPANTDSIPVTQITANDDFGFVETIESVPIGIPRPIGGANN